MTKKYVLFAAALILAAAWCSWYAVGRERALAGAFEMTTVLVARADLPAGTVLNTDLVETMQVPRRYMQQGAYQVLTMSDIKLVSGLTTIVRVPKGNQVLQSELAGNGAKPQGEATIAPALQHYLEGIKYYQNSNYEQARREWKLAKKLDPANTEVAAGLKRIEQILAGTERK